MKPQGKYKNGKLNSRFWEKFFIDLEEIGVGDLCCIHLLAVNSTITE